MNSTERLSATIALLELAKDIDIKNNHIHIEADVGVSKELIDKAIFHLQTIIRDVRCAEYLICTNQDSKVGDVITDLATMLNMVDYANVSVEEMNDDLPF